MTDVIEEREPRARTKTRWAPESSRLIFPGLPTLLPVQLDDEMLDQYLRILEIEEISRKLRLNEVLPPGNERSPSPEPIYGIDGKRTNTREARYRGRMESERHRLIEEALKADPLYRPPLDYRRPSKLSEKLYIPARDFPEINFIGLLIGPRGNTLKKIEAQSGGAKISIRGKGSAKEGKRETRPQVGDDEELHAVVMGETEESVRKAVELINNIIEEACSTPEAQLELKKNQLKELALLNGTLREDENQICQNCGEFGHRRYECPKRHNVTNSLICRLCGGMGHIASDCLHKNNPEAIRAAEMRNKQLDTDYARFMGEVMGDASNMQQAQATAAPWVQQSANLAPWQMPPMPMMPWGMPPPPPPSMSGMGDMPWMMGVPPPPPGGYPGAPPPPPGFFQPPPPPPPAQ